MLGDPLVPLCWCGGARSWSLGPDWGFLGSFWEAPGQHGVALGHPQKSLKNLCFFVYFHAFEVLGGAQGSLGVHEEGVWDDLGVVLEGREAQGIAPGRSLDRSRVP